MKVFLDTNILLDVLTKRKPHFDSSAKIWTLAEHNKMTGLIAAISFTNIYYVLGRLTGHKTADKVLHSLRNIFKVAPCNDRVINQAIDAGFDDFEDAVQYFCAVAAGAECIVTRDPDHFPSADLPILTPAEFLAAYHFDS